MKLIKSETYILDSYSITLKNENKQKNNFNIKNFLAITQQSLLNSLKTISLTSFFKDF